MKELLPIAPVLAVLAITTIVVALVVLRPGLTAVRGGKILAFFGFLIFPVVASMLGFESHIERSKETSFCLGCHIMAPYGKSLYVDDPSYIPAAHFQNARVPRDQACYTCHTDYSLYGGFKSKIRGLHHIYAQYLSTPQQPIKLYHPYNNRECLHCHLGARSFEQGAVHNADPQTMIDIKSNKLSCVSSGCHDSVHNISKASQVKYWKPEP
ncbi:MAG TPA: NapC/NirT family cytochrome c [Verrucomicrobiae bacterium]|nr:NapC/NirT family cytochrome c [Verrucomicrobiae bacterium]